MSSLQGGCDGPTLRPLETQVQQISFTLRTGLAERWRTSLPPSFAFLTCYFPLWVSPPSGSGVLKVVFSTFLLYKEDHISTEAAHIGSVEITVDDQKAAGAMIRSFTQGHLLPMVASAAILRRVGWVHFDERSASFFRFAREMIKELRPRRVTDAFRETMIVNHAVPMQIVNTDGSKRVDDLARVLMREIVASPFGSFMHTSDDLAMPAPLFRSLLQSGVLALDFCQCLFFFTEEARVRNFFSARESEDEDTCKILSQESSDLHQNGGRTKFDPIYHNTHRSYGSVPLITK